MGWSLGYDSNWNRWVGYGVPAWCDHPKCNEEIDRGLSYVCCGQKVYGGYDERGGGCGLFFCSAHSDGMGRCTRCRHGRRNKPYEAKRDHPDWLTHILKDKRWAKWRAENRDEVKRIKAALMNAPSTRG